MYKGIFGEMVNFVKPIASGFKIFFPKTISAFEHEASKILPLSGKNSKGLAKFHQTTELSIPIRPSTLNSGKPSFVLNNAGFEADEIAKAETGNMALRISQYNSEHLGEFKRYIESLFPGYKVEARAKSPVSTYSKLRKGFLKSGKTFKTDQDGMKLITDGMAARIAPHKLTKKDVVRVLNSIEVDGKPLTKREKRFVARILKDDKSVSKMQHKAAKKFVRPVLLRLAEVQSQPVVDRISLGMLKSMLERKLVTVEQLIQKGVNPEYIKELKNNPKIEALRVPRLCNYRGADGLPVFSDRQIREFEKINSMLPAQEKFTITSCPTAKDLEKYGLELTKDESEAIKEFGYTASKINIIFKDGTTTELQIGREGFYNIEHDIIYDGMQGKETVTPFLQPFQTALKSLGAKEAKYKSFVCNCYNADRRSELAVAPAQRKLPKGISKKLSREYMEQAYRQNQKNIKEQERNFIPYMEYVA